jgi:tetratricopeptide (TPR) repeat protein
LPWVALVLASAGPFAVGLGFDHAYDDHYTIVATPAGRMSVSEILVACLRGRRDLPDVSRPAMVLSARLDHALWGAHPLGTHLGSLVLYVASAGAAHALARVLLRRRDLALAAAVVWAALPIHAEVVVSPSYREDLFAAIGVFGTLALLLAPAAHPHAWARASCAALLTTLGLAGKESALTLLPLLLALAPALAARDAASWSEWAARRERSLALVALVVVSYAAWRAQLSLSGDGVARAAAGARGPHDDARYVLWAMGASLWPVHVEPIYPTLPPAGAGWWVGVAAVLSAWGATRRSPVGHALAFLVLGALVTAPSVGPASERADRYLLFTTFGAAYLVVLALAALVARAGGSRRHTLAVVGALALALATRSAWASRPWANDLALWTYATERVPESPKAWQARAWAERRAGHLEDAERSIARSLDLDPARPETRLSAAYIALERGDRDRARALLGALRDEGHGELRGLRRAWRCAFEVPEEHAAACLEEGLR